MGQFSRLTTKVNNQNKYLVLWTIVGVFIDVSTIFTNSLVFCTAFSNNLNFSEKKIVSNTPMNKLTTKSNDQGTTGFGNTTDTFVTKQLTDTTSLLDSSLYKSISHW